VLSTATLLRPAMRDLGLSGNAANHREIRRVLGNKEVIYTAVSREDNEKVLHVEFGDSASDKRFPSHRAFPRGIYD